MQNRSYQGVWEGKSFPKYQFQEYPKWVEDGSGKKVIVQNHREELAVVSAVPEGAIDPVLEAKNKLLMKTEEQKGELEKKDEAIKSLEAQNAEAMKLLKDMGDRLRELEKERMPTQVSEKQAELIKAPAETPAELKAAVEKPKAHTTLEDLLKSSNPAPPAGTK